MLASAQMTDATSLVVLAVPSRARCARGKTEGTGQVYCVAIERRRCMHPLQTRISISDLKVGETKICAEASISPQLLCASPRVSEPLGRVGLRRPPRACLRPSQGANSLPARSDRACVASWLPFLFLSFLFVLAQSVPDPSDPVAEAYVLATRHPGRMSVVLFVWSGRLGWGRRALS